MGKDRRLRKILKEDGRTFIVPMDHGLTQGPIKGLDQINETVRMILNGGVDAILVHKGIARLIDNGSAGLIIHLSGSTNLSGDPLNKVQVADVIDAIRLGADAVSIHINVGCPTESDQLKILGSVSSECEDYSLPLIAMMYPRGPKIDSEYAEKYVSHAVRIGVELGADIIKTNYTGSLDTFRHVVSACPVPVVMAGGPKKKSVEGFLSVVKDAMLAGASGVAVGRNVFQASNPKRMAAAISAIIHKGMDVPAALKVLGEG
ncbi:fructose-bisphosphate aldolase [Candidatus Bathyarchaeota archaeon ex4484_205]|nr:MAG: fructose-bisphosphate aldolase [Candidatus Bathyarchaeota archaeon ex4484_205]